jgi:hypothetical protein
VRRIAISATGYSCARMQFFPRGTKFALDPQHGLTRMRREKCGKPCWRYAYYHRRQRIGI